MPVVTPDYGYVHVPKTGGSHITRALAGTRVAGSHDPGWMVRPDDWAGRVLLGSVREPCTWYAAWYAHAVRANVADIGVYGSTFRDVIWAATHLEEAAQMGRVPKRPGVIWGPNKTPAKSVADLGDRGLCTWAVWYMLKWQNGEGEGWIPGRLIPTDRIDEALIALALDSPPSHLNPNPDQPDYREWYDDEMIEWVLEADRDIFALFDWQPFGSARSFLEWEPFLVETLEPWELGLRLPVGTFRERYPPPACPAPPPKLPQTRAEAVRLLDALGYVVGRDGTRGRPPVERARIKAALEIL